MEWFGNGKGEGFLEAFCDVLLAGDTSTIQSMLQYAVLNTVGHDDVAINKEENFYHGMLLGITLQLKGRYDVKSNRQAGFGLYDIALIPANPSKDPGVIIEVKTRDSAKSGLAQIEDNKYYIDLIQKNDTSILYGMRFNGMRVEVVKAGEDIVYGAEDAKRKKMKKKKRR